MINQTKIARNSADEKMGVKGGILKLNERKRNGTRFHRFIAQEPD